MATGNTAPRADAPFWAIDEIATQDLAARPEGRQFLSVNDGELYHAVSQY